MKKNFPKKNAAYRYECKNNTETAIAIYRQYLGIFLEIFIFEVHTRQITHTHSKKNPETKLISSIGFLKKEGEIMKKHYLLPDII